MSSVQSMYVCVIYYVNIFNFAISENCSLTFTICLHSSIYCKRIQFITVNIPFVPIVIWVNFISIQIFSQNFLTFQMCRLKLFVHFMYKCTRMYKKWAPNLYIIFHCCLKNHIVFIISVSQQHDGVSGTMLLKSILCCTWCLLQWWWWRRQQQQQNAPNEEAETMTKEKYVH